MRVSMYTHNINMNETSYDQNSVKIYLIAIYFSALS